MTGLSRETQAFGPDQLRLLVDAGNQYDQWLEQRRLANRYSGWMNWRTKNGVDYLTHGHSLGANQKSLGRRSPETERRYAEFTEGKRQSSTNLKAIEDRLAERAPMLRALRMGRILSPLAKVVREYDVQGLLGVPLMIVGTHAIAAYEAMAGRWFDSSLAATEDLDFVWRGGADKMDFLVNRNAPALLKHLKAVDSTFCVNTERTFQARNAKGLVVDFITSPEGEATIPKEYLRPIPIEGQQWLIGAGVVTSIAIDTSGLPVRIVAPDPRVFALHKFWISQNPERSPLKREKDVQQGFAVAALTSQYLPQYSFDETFLMNIAPALVACFNEYLSGVLPSPTDQNISM